MFLDPRTSFSHHKRSGKKLCAAQRWHFPRPWADWWELEGLFLDGRMDRYSNIFLPLCRDRNSILTTPGSTRNVRLSDMSAGSGPRRENSLFSIQLKGWRQVKKGLKDTAGRQNMIKWDKIIFLGYFGGTSDELQWGEKLLQWLLHLSFEYLPDVNLL